MTSGCQKNFSPAVEMSITAGTVAMSPMMTLTPPAQNSGEVTSTVGVNTFAAGAVADLLGLTNKTMHDVWQIDQEKNLVHYFNGAEF